MTLSPDQQAAVDAVRGGPGPFLLTGPAGTGKSHVINYLRDNFPDCVVTATTGAAAQLISGRTIHSFASIHPTFGAVRSHKANSRMAACGLLIMDEASMANAELFRQILQRCDQAGNLPKLLLVGDFLQLPPVDGVPLYKSPIWRELRKMVLTCQHRQDNPAFVSVLTDLRLGVSTDRLKDFISSRTVSRLPEDCTHLMAMRYLAERRNLECLRGLPGNQKSSSWSIQYSKLNKKKDVNLKDARFVQNLVLKVGARVVLLTNTNEWVNGSTGMVVEISKGAVRVELDTGRTVRVTRVAEDIIDPDGDVACSITQYPMMLAYGLTIHRAQGMTIDRVGVDLRGHFAPGQTYVALSRCRTPDGLFLVGHMDQIKVDQELVSTYLKLEGESIITQDERQGICPQ